MCDFPTQRPLKKACRSCVEPWVEIQSRVTAATRLLLFTWEIQTCPS